MIALLVSNNCFSEELNSINIVCQKDRRVTHNEYLHATRGKVVAYKTPDDYDPSPEDLMCATVDQMWIHRNHFPNKLTIVVYSLDYRRAIILQINKNINTLLLTSISIPLDKEKGKTVWTIMPDPMKRITEMLKVKVFPRNLKSKVKANYATINRVSVYKLVTGKN